MNAVVDSPVKPETRPYIDAFERGVGHRAEIEPGWLAGSRRRGLARFAETGFPSRKSESWRYLDLQSLVEQPLLPADPKPGANLDWARDHPTGLLLPGKGPRLVTVDALAAPELSSLDLPEGVVFGPTRSMIAEREHLFRAAVAELPVATAHPFAVLNPASFGDR